MDTVMILIIILSIAVGKTLLDRAREREAQENTVQAVLNRLAHYSNPE